MGEFGGRLLQNLEQRELKQARALLLILGLIAVGWQALRYGKLSDALAEVGRYGSPDEIALAHRIWIGLVIGFAIGGVFLACAALVYRKPVLATMVGLLLYCGTVLVQLALDPSVLFGSVLSIGVTAAIIIGLVSAARFARRYERKLREQAGA